MAQGVLVATALNPLPVQREWVPRRLNEIVRADQSFVLVLDDCHCCSANWPVGR